MSLTSGRGPLSDQPRGWFDRPIPHGVVYAEPFHRRVRGLDGERLVVDSDRVVLVHRPGMPPTYAFPIDDVHGAPAAAEPAVAGYVSVPWDSVDAWFEEEDEVRGHPRNPYHRIDCVRARRRLRVEVAGVEVVDTDDVVLVDETALAPQLYVRRELVRTDLLVPSETVTFCPYKGDATYWTAVIGDQRIDDVAWSYEDPVPESTPIAGLLSFDPERARVEQPW